ncbi:hypothetical protein AXG93_2465s1020 [Marchantia polymorpha subsp. ruderalis]|uniref:C-terminal of Roc (COR) domain-containing protein n=1 Tax=Marchantia polymorpha subsp. ruderalis TaxID=1480154 RepID=A0A176W1A3_MARPO|nr:hypothetical protein AXG93_2465s1020 [Marchantia polymorpha subsp. ruderalis]
MDEETFGIVSQALIHSSSLKALNLIDFSSWGAALLLKALARDDGNRSIEILQLWRMDRLKDCIVQLLTSNPSLKEVTFTYLDMRPEEWHQLGEVSRDSAIESVRFLRLIGGPCSNPVIDWKSIEALAWGASSDVKDAKLGLSLSISNDHDEWMLSLNLLGRVLRGEIKSLKSLQLSAHSLRTSGTNQDRMGSILSMNGKSGETSVLKSLILFGSEDLLKGVWKDLLRCLRGNTSLTHLKLVAAEEADSNLHLPESKLDEEALRDLMGLLQVNLTLEEIDVSETSWAKHGKAAKIKESLKQNRNRAVYMSVFREAKLTFGAAKAGRLFLCGSPRAGKTQLRRTLMSVIQGRRWLASKWNKFRTKGIEVEFLQNDKDMQISVWDLAGQWIFRTLQNVLFPQTNHFCVFLFVYSPFCKKTSSNKPDSCFRTELEEWLRFISSSTKVTGHHLPQVIVVISHKDKTRYPSLTWARSIVEELTKRFANFVDLRQEFFHVDARNNKQVIPLKSHVFKIFEKLLSDESPQIPHLCFQLTSLLVKNIKKSRSRPLWPSEEFYAFCAPSLAQHIPSSAFHSTDHSRIMDSIISYLNDVGSIIYIPNLDFIIVDPNWLTNTFLGELIALGQHFQADDSESADDTMSSEPYTSRDGFVSESVFAGLIEEFLAKHPHVQEGVDEKVLEDILINLDLCFKLEDPSQYFIPSFIPEHASTEEQKPQELAWETRDETSQFVGIRIQCQDTRRMSLTAAFFPCFQVGGSAIRDEAYRPGVDIILRIIQRLSRGGVSARCNPNTLRGDADSESSQRSHFDPEAQIKLHS